MTEGQQFIDHAALIEKAQGVRLLDVFALGPAMIQAANLCGGRSNLKALLMLAGIGTILYNGANYIRIEQIKRANDNGLTNGREYNQQ